MDSLELVRTGPELIRDSLSRFRMSSAVGPRRMSKTAQGQYSKPCVKDTDVVTSQNGTSRPV
jgi:hypothetical protein